MAYEPTGNPRGFAVMDPADRSEIARKGGKAAHKSGKAHNWRNDPEGARSAGRKGGSVRGKNGSGTRATSKTA